MEEKNKIKLFPPALIRVRRCGSVQHHGSSLHDPRQIKTTKK